MRQAPALHAHGAVEGVEGVEILKVLTRAEAETGAFPAQSVLLWDADATEAYAGSFSPGSMHTGRVRVSEVGAANAVQPGDVVRLLGGKSLVTVLYRRGANANRLFLTEQCNSLCLMCSQPPRNVDDAWRIEELYRTIPLIDRDEPQLTLTGGEPGLLGHALARLLRACRSHLPGTHLHVLTNGRLLRDPAHAKEWIEAGGEQTTWAVPLYADVAPVHDEIVGAQGAFDETLEGLYQLARGKARVEIRIVLHALSAPRLPQLASFIYRRLPFAEHIAWMGLEPMGLARSNRERLWIDPADYMPSLADAVHHLSVRGMNASIFNLPLCVLPKDLHRFARPSISDWKNFIPAECDPCRLKSACSGFFASAGPEWRSRLVAPILETLNELA